MSKPNHQLAKFVLDGSSPCVVFCPGFNSTMQGNKAMMLQAYCHARSQAFIRFDYRGHGESEADFGDCTISTWLADVLSIIDGMPDHELVLVGSSMGAWLALLAALQRKSRVRSLLLIACAVDMTRYYPERIHGLDRQVDDRKRVFYSVPNGYDDEEDYRIYEALLEDGRQHYLLDQNIELTQTVRLVHGLSDDVVEWQRSLTVANCLSGKDVRLDLIKGGDHRLSETEHLKHLRAVLDELLE